MKDLIPDRAYSVRRFVKAELDDYKLVRLEALEKEPGMFCNSLAVEKEFTEEQWRSRVENPSGACFGLFYKDQLIGITSIVSKTEEREAHMTQSYIRKAFRGKGLSRLLYNARIRWAREHQINKLIIGHRKSNKISFAANQNFGFTYTHSEPVTWPDGETDDMLYYELIL